MLAWRARHLLAGLALGCAAVVAVGEVRPAEPASAAVLTLTAALPAGTTLEAADVALRAVPVALAPDGALTDPTAAVGARLAVGLPSGYPLAPGLLAGPGLAENAPAGTVVAPVRLADAGVALLLGAGDVIDILAAPVEGTGGAANVLAQRALVLARADPEPGGLLDPAGSESPLLLVAVSPETATLLSGAIGWTHLGAVLVAGG